ncbi:restriction endonuclease subunit S [Bacillus mobilis]|uniref:restriction endonuclease subunit S n=1 Tax=Bacillus mobilis TaxID=2026190 RepID=UPI00289014B9|nr:restriction endonuclease subunit S [Bacillus cereus]
MNKVLKIDEIVSFEKTYSFSRAIEGVGEFRHIHYGDIHTKLPSVIENATILPTITEKKDFQVIEQGDILVADASEDYKDLGKAVCYIGDDTNVIAGLHTHLLRSNKNIVDPEYLINLFQTNRYQKYVWKMGTGVSVLGLSKSNLGKYEVHLPTLNEQKKVANFFNKLNKKIQLQQQKIELLQEQKKGYMQKIFKQEIRFKDEDGKDYPEWENKKVKDIFHITRGHVLSTNKISEKGSYPVYSSQTKNNGLLGYYNDFLFENAITWTTDGANAGNVKYRSGKFYCTNVCGVLLNNVGYANKCIAEMLNSVAFKYVSYVGNPKLMNNVMGEISLNFPCVEEQEKISNILIEFDKKIVKEEDKLEELNIQKRGFIQRMFI